MCSIRFWYCKIYCFGWIRCTKWTLTDTMLCQLNFKCTTASFFFRICNFLQQRICVVFLAGLFVFVLCHVYPMLPVSLDYPFMIAPSVFSNVYLLPTVCPVSCVPNVASVSGLSIHDCPFGFLYRLCTDKIHLITLMWYNARGMSVVSTTHIVIFVDM